MLEDGTRYIWGPQTLPFAFRAGCRARSAANIFFLTGYRLFMVALVLAGGDVHCS